MRRSAAGIACGLWLALMTAPAIAQSKGQSAQSIEERLGQAWRWREIEPPADAGGLRYIGSAGEGALVGLFVHQVAYYDGYRWHPMAELARGSRRGPAFAQAVPGGILIYDGRVLGSIDLQGRRRVLREQKLLQPFERRGTIGARPLLVTRDGVMRATLTGMERLAEAPGGRVFALETDRTGRIWASTEDGIRVCRNGHWKAVQMDAPQELYQGFGLIRNLGETTWFLPCWVDGHDAAFSLRRDGATARRGGIKESIWAATVLPGGELVGAGASTELWIYKDGKSVPVALPLGMQIQIHDLVVHEGRHLVCRTISGRIFTCDLVSNRWRIHRRRSLGNVLSLSRAREGGLWVGADTGLFHFDGENLDPVVPDVANRPLRVVTALHEDQDGTLWVGSGSHLHGVLRRDPEKKWHLHQEQEGVERFGVHAIRPGREGEIWFLLLSRPGEKMIPAGGGAVLYANGRWKRYSTADGLPALRCYDLTVTPSGVPWVGTLRGAAWWDGNRFHAAPDPGDEARSVKRLLALSDGSVWSGSRVLKAAPSGALPRGASILPYTDAAAMGMLEDDRGRVWLSSPRGVYLHDGKIRHHITREPGAPTHAVWPMLADPGGVYWFGTVGKGLARYEHDDVHAPQTLDLEVTFDEERGETKVTWRGADYWNVTPKEQLRFRCRLDDAPWSKANRETELRSYGLESGEHVIEVQAIDRSGNYGRSVRRTFTVRPPLLARPAVYIPALAVLLVGVALGYRLLRQRRRRREVAGREEIRVRELIRHADVLLASFGPDASLRYVSPPFEAFIGHESDALRRDSTLLGGLVHPDDRARASGYLAPPLLEGPESAEFRLRHEDDSWRWVMATIAARTDERGDSRGWDFVAVDVSERKRTEEERRHAQKLESLGVLAGGLAHDFNNLLASILGNAGLARETLPPDAPAARTLAGIERAALRASDLTNQMLAYSGKGFFEITTFDLSPLVEEMTQFLEASAGAGAKMHYGFAEDPVCTTGDAAQIRQVVMNLITNASDAIDRQGEITLRTGAIEVATDGAAGATGGTKLPAGPYVFLEVSDTGCGMDENSRAKMFDPFFTTKFTGRGLGLAAVQGIVRAHKGAIHVDSAPGEGTTVRIVFPRTHEAPTPPEPVPESPKGWRGEGRVLVVDDEELVREVTGQILERAGFKVVAVEDGAGAIRYLAEHDGEITLVLLDLTMPGMTGEECFEALREIRGDVPVIIMSGYSRRAVTARLRDQGTSGFLQKPYQSRELLAAVRQALS